MTLSLQRNIVFFLGAGFSVDAGLPIMSNFGQESRIDYDTLSKHAKADPLYGERYAAPILVEAAEAFYAFQILCKKSPTITDKDVNNFETVFSIAEAMIEAGEKTIQLQHCEYSLEQLVEKIQLWLWKIYQQYPPGNPNRKTHLKTYKDFFRMLRDLGACDKTFVISTNYDLIFEYMAWNEIKTPCVYPFGENLLDIIPINVGNGENYVFYEQDNEETKIPICKLHGSVNFFEDTASKNDKLFVTTELGGNIPIGKSGTFKNKSAIFAVDAIWKIREVYGKSLTPAIIPPTYAKLSQKQWQRAIWQSALNSLRIATTIIFIGYSMPPTDGFIRALIHSSLALRGNEHPPDIFVIDPNDQVHKNYADLFNNYYRYIGYHTFGNAIKTEVIKDILKSSK
jgi:hypothetical protein